MLVIDGQHVPAETIEDENAGARIIDFLNGNLAMFNGSIQVDGGAGPQEESPEDQ